MVDKKRRMSRCHHLSSAVGEGLRESEGRVRERETERVRERLVVWCCLVTALSPLNEFSLPAPLSDESQMSIT